MNALRAYCSRNYRWLLWLAFPLLSLAMHSFLFDLPLQGIHAWRQCETASNVSLFAAEGYGMLDPHVYSLEWEGGLKRMEFPIMQWLFALFFKVFGEHVFILRILSWVLGFATMVGCFKLMDLLFRDKFLALAGAWCWMFSPVIFYYSINPLPDNFSLMAAVWGMVGFLHWYRSTSKWSLISGFACFSMATATKLPFIVFFALPFGGMLGSLIRQRGKNFISFLLLGLAGLLILAPALGWYAWVIPQWTGNGVIKGILDTTAEDLPVLIKTFGKNILVILPELLINYASVLFFVWGIWRIWRERLFRHPLAIPFGLYALGTGAYFVFEINMISSVHDYYLFPFLPGIFTLVVLGLRWFVVAVKPWHRTLAMVLLLLLPVTAGLRAYTRWSEKGMPAGLLANVDALRAATPADAKIIFGNDLSPHISLYHLKHFGWTLDESEFNAEKFEWYLKSGAEYLYSTSRKLEENPVVAPHLGELMGEWGGLRVWGLK